MKRVNLLLLTLLLAYASAFADNCPRCHGSRRVKTSYDISTYGLTTEKTVCRYCGESYTKGTSHWDDCPLCGGTGQTSSAKASSYSSSTSSSNSFSDPFVHYLSPDEYMIFQEAMQVLARGVYKPVKCKACNGTGSCQSCNGQGFLVPPTLYTTMVPCPNFNCHAGMCRVCKGQGTVDNYSHEEADLAPIKQRLQGMWDYVWEKQRQEYENDMKFARQFDELEKEELAAAEKARQDSIEAAKRDSIEAARLDSIEAAKLAEMRDEELANQNQQDIQDDVTIASTPNQNEDSNTSALLLLTILAIIFIGIFVFVVLKKKNK